MENACIIDDCERPRLAQGRCQLHYDRDRRTGALVCVRPAVINSHGCGVTDCRKPAYGRGFCQAHYERARKYGDPLASAPKKTGQPCNTESCSGLTVAKGMCRNCYARCRRHGSPLYSAAYMKRFDRIIDDQGYAHVYDPGHPNARQNGRVPEHRLVVSNIIGRPLTDEENVHHKNGVKSDNRPENLELWVSAQPRGQRPADLADWAREILALYPPEVLAALAAVEVEVVAQAA